MQMVVDTSLEVTISLLFKVEAGGLQMCGQLVPNSKILCQNSSLSFPYTQIHMHTHTCYSIYIHTHIYYAIILCYSIFRSK